MIYALTAIIAVFITEITSYWLHRVMHWTKARYHELHHDTYPPSRYLVDKYVNPGLMALFLQSLVYAAPLLAVTGFLYVEGAYTLAMIFFGSGVLYGLLSQYLHDAYHIKGHWLEKFDWFRQKRLEHLIHHMYPNKNLGIVFNGFDRVFRTYKKRK